MRPLPVLAAALIVLLIPTQVRAADCGHPGVRVSGTAEEVVVACRALAQVLAYFEALGFRPEPQVAIRFEERVEIVLHDPRGDADPGRAEVSGSYDPRRGEVRVVSGLRDLHRDRRPWGFSWEAPVAFSILQHELTHAMVAGILGAGAADIGSAWHELIAYAVQFHLMEPALRDSILARYPGTAALQGAESVNPMTHAMDPEAFAVAAFRFVEERGGPAFILNLLTGGAPFETGELQLLWTE